MTDFRILGPVAVSDGGRMIEIGGPRLRKLLAILLLRANEPVPRGTLVHDLWGDQPPAGAQGSLEVYVSRLRKVLGSSVVLTWPGAYCLQADDGRQYAPGRVRTTEEPRTLRSRETYTSRLPCAPAGG